MFPIIPYNLATRVVYGQDYYGKKVLAGCDLPKDTETEVIGGEELGGKLENTSVHLEVELSEEHKLVLKTKKYLHKCHWIRAIRLADDCHSYNAKLCLQHSSNDSSNTKFVIQITKSVRNGQELLLWFSEDILAHLQMAFLTPANIQGQKKYVCHHCCATFEYPNPLKLHLTLDCNKQQIFHLWDRLAKLSNALNSEPKSSFGFQLLKANTKEKYTILNLSKSTDEKTIEYNPLKLSTNLPFPEATKSSISPTIEIQRPFSEPSTIHSSAFKPYPTKKVSHNQIRLSQSVSNFTTLTQNLSLDCHSQPMIQPQNYQNIVDLNHAAHMETLVSNLGKSKQGHLCIYCGKCYSRKYGLKIHIRTHTGYKPLKCKYCLRPFGDPSNLNKHVRLHAEGDTPYKCELCGKILVRRRDLERHLRSRHMGEIHLGEKVDETINSSSEHSDD